MLRNLYNKLTPSEGSIVISITGNITRQVPKGCARIEPAPLILAFHGKGQNASAMQSQTQFSNPEFNNDTIVVNPQGINKQWSGDPEAPTTDAINDIEFANDLLDYI